LGRINPIKNIHLLIEAINQLSENIKSSYILLIVGEAILDYEKTYLDELINLVNKLNLTRNVKFLGGIYGKQKEQILAESFCTVLPSQSENFGNVVLESLCQATPVIVSKNTPWQIIDKYKAGFYIVANIENIKNAILSLINLPKAEYSKMQENALLLAKSEFNINEKIDIWYNFYNSVLRDK